MSKYKVYPTRESKLNGRNVIKLISKNLGMTDEELLGMILVLRSEMGDSIYHLSFYRFVIVKLFGRNDAA